MSGLMVDLYRKLSFPLVSFVMAIIGVPFSFTTGKKGAFYGIGLSIVVGIFYWATFELFDKLGVINRLSPLIAAWFPNLIFGFGGILDDAAGKDLGNRELGNGESPKKAQGTQKSQFLLWIL